MAAPVLSYVWGALEIDSAGQRDFDWEADAAEGDETGRI